VSKVICCCFEEIGEPGKKTSEETVNLNLPEYEIKEVSDRKLVDLRHLLLSLLTKYEIVLIINSIS